MKRSVLALTTLLTATLALSSVARADEQTDELAIRQAYHALIIAAFREPYNVDRQLAYYTPGFTSK